MKYSRTALGLLNAQYRSVLRKCFLINAGLFALWWGVAATQANATEYTTRQKDIQVAGGDIFRDISSSTNGGALYEYSIDATVSGAIFRNNKTSKVGGAVYSNRGLLVNGNTEFIGNSTTASSGGAIGAYGKSTIIGSSEGIVRFTENSAGTYGGGVHIYQNMGKGASLTTLENAIINAVFDRNTAKQGGAVALSPGLNVTMNSSITGASFNQNKATGDKASIGGAIVKKTASDTISSLNLTIKDSKFKDNIASYTDKDGMLWGAGGAIAEYDGVKGYTSISNSKFTSNIAGAEGGAIVSDSILNIEDTDFETNKTTSVMIGSSFADTAEGGGAVFLYDASQATIINSTFTENESGTFGGAISTRGVSNGASGANSTLTVEDSSFTNNQAKFGGAIASAVNTTIKAVNKDVEFSGNKANGADNDIYMSNTATSDHILTLDAAEGRRIVLEGGVDGNRAYTMNVDGAGTVEIKNAVKNANTTVNSGELYLNEVTDATGSTFNVAKSALLNTIDGAVRATTATFNVADGAKIAFDMSAKDGTFDQTYTATAGDKIYLTNLNLTDESYYSSALTKSILSAGTVDVSEVGTIYTKNASYTVTANENEITVTRAGTTGGLEVAADKSTEINKINYNLTEDDSITTEAKEIADIFVINGTGIDDEDTKVTLDKNLTVANGANLTLNSTRFVGTTGALNNEAGAVLNVKDSRINVAVNNAGTMYSDPSYYGAEVVNTGSATFDNDTFESGSSLTNSATVNLIDTTFAAGSTLTGNEGNVLNLVSGTSVFNGTSSGNNVVIASGADFSGNLTGGTVNTQNNNIDAITGTVAGSDLSIDASLGTTTAADTFGTGSTGTIKSINLTSSDYGTYATDDTKTISGFDGLTVDSNVAITGATNYYTKVEVDGSGNLVFSDKLVNTSGMTDYVKENAAAADYDANETYAPGSIGKAIKGKQDALTVGDNITISGTTISAKDTTYAAGNGITITGATNIVAVNLDTVAETTDHKVMTDAERTKLGGIAANAQVNVIEGVQVNGSDLTPDANKKVNVTIAEGSTNGTIKMNGTDVAVHGLDTAAYAKTTDFDAAGTATGLISGLDATVSQTAGGDGLALEIVETDGKITSISGSIAANTYDSYGSAAIVDAKLGGSFSSTNTVANYLQETTGMNQAHSAEWNYNQSSKTLLHGATSMLEADEKLAGAIDDINTAITVTADGNYIKAADNVKTNLGYLDTQVKTNADNISTLVTNTTIETAEATAANHLTAGADLAGNVVSVANALANTESVVGKQTTAYSGGALNGKTIGAGDTSTDVSVAGALGLLNNASASADAKFGSIADAISGTWDGNTFTHTAFSSINNLTSATTPLTTAISDLDKAMGDVDNITVAGYSPTSPNTKDVVGAVNQLNNNFTNGNIAANFASVEAAGGFKVDDNNALTSAGLKASSITADSATISGQAQVGSLKIGTTSYGIEGTGNATLNGVNANSVTATSGTITTLATTTLTTNTLTATTSHLGTADASSMSVTGNLSAQSGNFSVDTSGTHVNGMFEVTNGANKWLNIDSDGVSTFKKNADNTVTINGSTYELEVKGKTQLDGTLDVTGLASLDGGIDVNDKFTVGTDGNVETKGTVNINGATLTGSDTALTSDKKIVSVNGFEVDTNNSLTTAGLKASAADIDGDLTVGDKFSVTASDGSFSAAAGNFWVNKNGSIHAAGENFVVNKNGSINAGKGNFVTDTHGNATVKSKLTAAEYANANDTFTVDENGKITSTGLDAGSGTIKTTGAVEAGTLTTTGAATIGGDLGVRGSAWLKNTHVDGALEVTGQSYLKDTSVDGALTSTGIITGNSGFTNADGSFAADASGNVKAASLTFNGTDAVNAIDTGTAITDGDATTTARKETIATTATVAATVGNLAGLTSKNNGVTTATDVATAIDSLATNVETATGGTFSGATWTGSLSGKDAASADLAVKYGTNTYNDIMSAVNQVYANVGNTNVTGTNENILSTNTVNQNLDKIDTNIGKISTLNGNALNKGTTTQPTTVVAALQNINDSIGKVHGLYDGSAVASTNVASTVNGNSNLMAVATTGVSTAEDHLVSLDNAIGDRTLASKNTTINNEMSSKSVAAGLKAAGDAIGDMNFGESRYVGGTNDLSSAVRTLDSNLYRVESDVRDLRRDFNRGMASMAAMSALVPNPRAHGNTSLAIGTGAYSGHTAAAIGGFHYLTDNIMLNAGAAWGNSSDASYRMGITFSW